MTPQKYQRLKSLFAQAGGMAHASRAALLEQVGREDHELHAALRELLQQDGSMAGFLDQPVIRVSQVMDDADSDPHRDVQSPTNADGVVRNPGGTLPERVGPYHVQRVLGEGGMGVVYLAEQANPRRTVALKVLKPGVASERALRRFQHEAQMLGRLRHPHIAQVYEAGTAMHLGREQPWFAMELIHGQPITDYAEAHHLDMRDRLHLLRQVCDAVHHAHQKGVIHRDLKPGNILVDESSGRPQPKVLDFGVARVTDAQSTMTSVGTDVGQLIGTFPYMSPEQVGGDPLELDTRSDVYALGVVTYVLLTGRLPYDLARKTLPEAARIIAHDDPTPMSRIDRVFRGDLETIVAKALEKDKTRRYQSAAELGSDIDRYLRDEPIMARPASATYQLRKFARRNRGLVASAIVVAMALMLGVAGTLWQAVRATRGWDRAIQADNLANERLTETTTARDEARSQAALAKSVTGFITSILNSVDPEIARGRDITLLRSILDDAAARIGQELRDQPLAQAEVLLTIGNAYWSLGLYEPAEQQLRACVELCRQTPGAGAGADLADLIVPLAKLGHLLADSGRADEGEQMLREALAIGLAGPGADDPGVAAALNSLGEVLWAKRSRKSVVADDQEAEQLFLQALTAWRAARGPQDMEVARVFRNLGILYQGRKDYVAAEQHLQQALEILRADEKSSGGRALAAMEYQVAALREAQGRIDEAHAAYRRSLDAADRLLSPDHPFRATVCRALARLLAARSELRDAERLFREALRIDRLIVGQQDLKTADDASGLATTLDAEARASGEGDRAEAEQFARLALAAYAAKLPPDHPWIARARGNLARILHGQRRFAEAEPLLREALAAFRAAHGENHPDVARALIDLGSAVQAQDRPDEAEPIFAQALDIRRRILPPGNAAIGDALLLLGRVKMARDDAAGAEPLLREALDLWTLSVPGSDRRMIEGRTLLGDSLRRQGRFDEAEPILRAALDDLAAAPATAGARAQPVIQVIVQLYDDWNRPDEAARYRAQLAASPP